MDGLARAISTRPPSNGLDRIYTVKVGVGVAYIERYT